jgi:hypothetical protein
MMTKNKFLLPLFFSSALLSIALGSSEAKAALLVVGTPTDKPLKLDITLKWEPENIDDVYVGDLNHWRVVLGFGDLPLTGNPPVGNGIVDPDLDQLIAQARHKTNPHTDELDAPFITLPLLVPKSGVSRSTGDSVIHPGPENHRDIYSVTFTRGTGSSLIRIKGVHTPEPATNFSLLALSTLGAVSTLKRKQNQKSTEKGHC